MTGVSGKMGPGAGLVLPLLLLGDEEVAMGEDVFLFCFLGGICRAADACLSGCNWGVFCTVTSGRRAPREAPGAEIPRLGDCQRTKWLVQSGDGARQGCFPAPQHVGRSG